MLPRSRVTPILLTAGLLSASPVCAQDGAPLVYGRSHRISSQTLGEERVLDVALPAGYDRNPERRYPVLVILDGESQHQLASALVSFQASAGELPEMIVVGVRNTNRTRDLSPPAVRGWRPPPELGDDVGGADRFLRFLEQELSPYLDSAYRTAPLRVLAGHSLGGAFALYALAQQPTLFTGYVVMEPSTWWNGGNELESAREVLRQPRARNVRVIGVNAPSFGADTLSKGGAAPMVRDRAIFGETHLSMPAAGMLTALKTMFADFRPIEWRPGLKPIATITHFDSLSARFGYSVPIPPRSYMLATRMSLDGRFFDDAATLLRRWESAYGATSETRAIGERLARERHEPTPSGFVALEVPASRPTADEAAPFFGRWLRERDRGMHELEILASGDTVLVSSREQFEPGGQIIEGVWPVIQITPDGVLEIGAPYLRGVPGVVVFRCTIATDGSLAVDREVRGFLVPQNWGDLTGPLEFRKAPRGATGG